TCISLERVYVEAPVYDEFVGKVREKMSALRVGAPHGPGSVDVGAITFPPQLDTVTDHVSDAVSKGARVLVGGKTVANVNGRFFQPTLLVNVDHTMKIMTEETFGPTLPIMKVADADEAVRLANDSPYGPGAWKRARRMSTTQWSTTPRSSCPWAVPRRRESAPGTAPGASASTAPSRRSWWPRRSRSRAKSTCSPPRPGHRG